MYPIPCFFLKLANGGSIELPPGSIKKIAMTRHSDAQKSMAVLLNNGNLYTQGDNTAGECGDGTTLPFYDHWHNVANNVNDVYGVGSAFVLKYNDNGWQYIGNTNQLTGAGGDVYQLTSFPSTISNTIPLANLSSVIGSPSGTLWVTNSGTLYGSGVNSNGCLGSGNSNAISTPRIISSSCVRAFMLTSCATYLNNVGSPRVCGNNYGISGTNTTSTTNFVSVTFTGITEQMYVKEWLCNEGTTIAVASTAANDQNNYLYTRGVTTNKGTYAIVPDFGPFSDFRVIDGGQSHYIIIDNLLYTFAAYKQPIGLGNSQTDFVSVPTLLPVVTGDEWDLSKLTYIVDIKSNNLVNGAPQTHWMVYDGNLFYTGNPAGFFGKTQGVGTFTNIPENLITS